MDYKVYKNNSSTCLKDAENSYYINLVNEKQPEQQTSGTPMEQHLIRTKGNNKLNCKNSSWTEKLWLTINILPMGSTINFAQ